MLSQTPPETLMPALRIITLSLLHLLPAHSMATEPLFSAPPQCSHANCSKIASNRPWPEPTTKTGKYIALGGKTVSIPTSCDEETIVPGKMYRIRCENENWMITLKTEEDIEPPYLAGIIKASGYTVIDLPRLVFNRTPPMLAASKPAPLWFERNAMILKRGWFSNDGIPWQAQNRNYTLYVCNNCNETSLAFLTDKSHPDQIIEAQSNSRHSSSLVETVISFIQ